MRIRTNSVYTICPIFIAFKISVRNFYKVANVLEFPVSCTHRSIQISKVPNRRLLLANYFLLDFFGIIMNIMDRMTMVFAKKDINFIVH